MQRFRSALVLLFVCALLATPTVEAGKNRRSSALSGVVVSMKDRPLAGVAVQLVPAEGGAASATELTDEQGRFSFKLPAGEYVLKLSRDGLIPVEQPVSLAGGKEQSLRAQMLDTSMGQRNSAIAAYNAAVGAHAEGDAAGAIRHLEEAVALDPTFREALSLLAEMRSDQAASAEAAAAAEPRAIEAYNEGARASQAGNVAEAVDRFRAALELNPAFAEAHVGLASIDYNRGRYDDALAAVERALALQPDHGKALRIRVLIHEARGDRPASVAAVVAWAAADAAAAIDLLSGWADVDFRAGRRLDAATALLAMLEIEPDRAETHYRLGLVYAQDEPDKAREHLRRFIALAPNAPEVASAKELIEKL